MNKTSMNTRKTIDIVQQGLPGRYQKERRFRIMGLSAIVFSLIFLVFLFSSIFLNGYKAFYQTAVMIDVFFDPAVFDVKDPGSVDYNGLIKKSLRAAFPDVTKRKQKKKLYGLVSSDGSFQLQDMVLADPSLVGKTQGVWLLADDDLDMLMKGYIDRDLPESARRMNDMQISWVDQLQEEGRIRKQFNKGFFTNGDSREPESAGIMCAMMGSFYMLIITLALSFPIGIGAAIYLEEFAVKNKITDLIEVNINNLAAVPSIVFGLLGLAVFLNFFQLPRSAPLVGGLVLFLMTLPTIIITSRVSLQSVPPSIREAALGVGASKMQAVIHHVLPLAMPGMLTGTIIGMARALGESAPLLMIGMVAFIVDTPAGVMDPATALPVQIYLWADSPERAFVERTSAAIMVLLAFLMLMNGTAVYLRSKFERRW
ncbi:MAG: phosphate ABC transporter permease PstA [Thermodesulfobacteriota bacterium]|nr:phosphate ABC transporter permease PstA [Thermodesulfobacteriota bacterium]